MNIYSGFTLQHSLPFPFSYEMLQRNFNYLQNWGSYNANNVKEVKSGPNHLQTEDKLFPTFSFFRSQDLVVLVSLSAR